MHLNEYQGKAWQFAQYPKKNNNPEYATLGLTGEAGEIANKVKKLQRDNLASNNIANDIAAELGDVLWYVAAVATEFGLNLDVIGQANLMKLESRKVRGVIRGSGDNR